MSWIWQGRQLTTAEKGGTTLSYTYDSEGIRTSKTVGSTTTKYLLNGTQILAQKTGSTTLSFFYDQQGNRVGMADSSNHFYYYIYNVQGDVIALADASTGKLAVTYTYDAWGKLVKLEDSTANSVGSQNPFRYKGYYYDTETSLYYLQTRYYDPDTGRFINADAYATTDAGGVLSSNMFAYCENNPILRSDPTGEWVHILVGGILGGVSACIDSLSDDTYDGNLLFDTLVGVASGALGAVHPALGYAVDAMKTVYDISTAKKGKVAETIATSANSTVFSAFSNAQDGYLTSTKLTEDVGTISSSKKNLRPGTHPKNKTAAKKAITKTKNRICKKGLGDLVSGGATSLAKNGINALLRLIF